MQHRRTIAIATGLALGLTVGVAPHAAGAQVAASPAFAYDALWPVDALDAFVVAPPVEVEIAPPATPTPGPSDADLPDGTEIGTAHSVERTTVAVAEAVAADETDSGSIHVEVAVAEDGERWVSLRSPDGTTIGPILVTGDVIVFDELDAGSYDLFAEQFTDGGGTFLTRTAIDVDRDAVVARCDRDTLDCTVA